jgi:hypothetical protein
MEMARFTAKSASREVNRGDLIQHHLSRRAERLDVGILVNSDAICHATQDRAIHHGILNFRKRQLRRHAVSSIIALLSLASVLSDCKYGEKKSTALAPAARMFLKVQVLAARSRAAAGFAPTVAGGAVNTCGKLEARPEEDLPRHPRAAPAGQGRNLCKFSR